MTALTRPIRRLLGQGVPVVDDAPAARSGEPMLLGDLIQGQTVAVAGSTLLAAALFQPLRRRVQVAVDHRFNRARYDADRTANEFAELLRNETDLASVSGDIVGVVDTALRPTTVGVWIRPTRPTTP